jgi:hypothetical protein
MGEVHNVDASRVHWEDFVDDRSFKACRQQRRAADEGATDMMNVLKGVDVSDELDTGVDAEH